MQETYKILLFLGILTNHIKVLWIFYIGVLRAAWHCSFWLIWLAKMSLIWQNVSKCWNDLASNTARFFTKYIDLTQRPCKESQLELRQGFQIHIDMFFWKRTWYFCQNFGENLVKLWILALFLPSQLRSNTICS